MFLIFYFNLTLRIDIFRTSSCNCKTVFPFLIECNGAVQTINLTPSQTGSIYSPNYPSRYGRNENCKWRLTAPYGQKILIYFTSFDLETVCCSCDMVKIVDGWSDSYHILSKGCRKIVPPPVYSSGRYP